MLDAREHVEGTVPDFEMRACEALNPTSFQMEIQIELISICPYLLKGPSAIHCRVGKQTHVPLDPILLLPPPQNDGPNT